MCSVEPAGGMVPTMPITLILMTLVFPSLWRRRAGRTAVLVAAALALACLSVIFLVSFALWGSTQRYEVDFATFGLLAAYLQWALLISRTDARTVGRRVLAVGGVLLTAWGVVVGVATSFTGYYGLL